jgi:hypothetical protein
MDGTLGPELAWKVLPLRAVIEYPEDASECPAFVHRRPAAFGRDRRVGHTGREPFELFVGESHRHATLFVASSKMDARFTDSLYSPPYTN